MVTYDILKIIFMSVKCVQILNLVKKKVIYIHEMTNWVFFINRWSRSRPFAVTPTPPICVFVSFRRKKTA